MRRSTVLAAVIVMNLAVGGAETVILESCADGHNFSGYKELEGKWTTSITPHPTAKSLAPGLTTKESCGTRKAILPQNSAIARFTPTIQTAGRYHVYATWPKAANAAPVTYYVKHAKGEANKQLKQWGWFPPDENGNQWILIGDYDFAAGSDGYVEVRVTSETQPVDKDQNHQAYADAVMFTTDQVASGGGGGAGSEKGPESIVIESRPEGQNHDKYTEVSGSWFPSGDMKGHGKSFAPGVSDPYKAGTRKSVCGADARSKDVAAARFIPKLAAKAHYHVYATWPREANADPVTYVIKHAGGEEKKELRQNGWGANGASNANIWVSLGEYDFNPGDDQYVEVQKDERTQAIDPRNLCQVYADAVQFSAKPLETTRPTPAAGVTSSAPATTPAVQDPGPLNWLNSVEEALNTARTSGQRILVFFYTPDNLLSNYFEQTVFADPAVKTMLRNNFVIARINFMQNPSVAYQLQVFRAGTIMIYDSKGNHQKKIADRKAPQEFLNELR